MAAPFYKPISSDWEFLLFHILISIWCYQKIPDLGHSKWFAVVSHCSELRFHGDVWCGASFVCFFAICISPLVRSLARILIGLFSYCWVLTAHCIFPIIVFYQMSFANIFPLLCGLSLLTLSFAEQKCLMKLAYYFLYRACLWCYLCACFNQVIFFVLLSWLVLIYVVLISQLNLHI